MTAYTRNRLLFAILLLSAMGLQGQMVTGMSDIAIQCVGCGVDSYSLTELDYAAAQYYDARADGFLSRGGSIVNSRSAYGAPYVDFYLSTALYSNTTYQIQTNHWIRAYYLVYVTEYGDYRYEDPYGFSWLDTGNYDQSAQIEPSYTYSYVTAQDIYVGATYTGFHSPSPVIDGINVLGSPTRGGTGHVEIYGSYFDGLQSVSIGGGGISTSVTYQSDTQVNISYSIASSASTGARNLTLTTIFGPSNSKTFTVYDPTPAISSVTPSSWPAGMTSSFTIVGSGFGTAPALSITGSGILSYGISSSSDTQIQATVSIDQNAPAGQGTITVTSNGYGQSFTPQTPSQPRTATAGVSITAAAAALNLQRAGLLSVMLQGYPSVGTYSFSAPTRLAGSSIIGVSFAPGMTPTTSPNAIALVQPANPYGTPYPGGLAAVDVRFTAASGMSATKSFNVPTFGLSCYHFADEQDSWDGSACQPYTIRNIKYSGSTTNPPGLTGTFCTAFLEETKLNGSGIALDGRKIKYIGPGFTVVSSFVGADLTPLVANQTVARDRTIVPRDTRVSLAGYGDNLVANDIGGDIDQYRIDLFKGTGRSVCSGFSNPIVVGACDPGNSNCPASILQ